MKQKQAVYSATRFIAFIAKLKIPSVRLIQAAKNVFQTDGGQSRIKTWIKPPKTKVSYLSYAQIVFEVFFAVLIRTNDRNGKLVFTKLKIMRAKCE